MGNSHSANPAGPDDEDDGIRPIDLPRSPASLHLSSKHSIQDILFVKDTSQSSHIDSGEDHESHAEHSHAPLHISVPARRKHIRHLSELIDPTTLAENSAYVKSPSGNLLDRGGFAIREDRPLSLRERQERIKKMMAPMDENPTESPCFTVDPHGHKPIKHRKFLCF